MKEVKRGCLEVVLTIIITTCVAFIVVLFLK